MKNKFFWIAEVGSNHNGCLERGKKIIKEAKKLGFDAVKFQYFQLEKLFSETVIKKSKSHRKIKKFELNFNNLKKLSNFSKKVGLKFGCSVFDTQSIDTISSYVNFFKIGSYELLRKDIFEKIITQDKHVIFSTGMATEKEILKRISFFKKRKNYNFSILRCVSNYPTKVENTNLSSIRSLKKILINNKMINIKVGWSDHTVSIPVILNAIFLQNIDVLEMHFDIDKKGAEYSKKGHCWLPNEIKLLKKFISDIHDASGNIKLNFGLSEKYERSWRSDPTDGLRPMKHIRKKMKF